MRIIGIIEYEKYLELYRNEYATDFNNNILSGKNKDEDFDIFRNICKIRAGVPHLPFCGIVKIYGREVDLEEDLEDLKSIFYLNRKPGKMDIIVELDVPNVEVNVVSLDSYVDCYNRLYLEKRDTTKKVIKQIFLDRVRIDTATKIEVLDEPTYIGFLPEVYVGSIVSYVALNKSCSVEEVKKISQVFTNAKKHRVISTTEYFKDI